ncbi:isocitrate lyase/phosphoenolpyruvate mutase family protein [Klugiella xanthotipulae]|uniref:2-methylisocitrate lyase-like PEP mutase family enzyme n=1 Tax=Klugiella xanthotipulae TaxID=244735 RepID=A0A543I647_9MICO|nr:isocitrate lyase/phosphoenolpyruvate mutase family protein [Klugiella xanthotipulae]TQM66072.1 2-methylisocitrate lyase-like PEP mutase family enzyme [Klugiella xanthotipulae]
MQTTPTDTARLFHALHTPSRPLALVTVWDAASALVAEAAGAPALATTSAGVSWSLGFPDGDQLDRERALAAVARITAAVRVPVTADIETGYSGTDAGVADTVARLLAAGVVGINLEDGAHPPGECAARIEAARTTAERAGIPLFINARTDVFLGGIGPVEDRLSETISRAARYVAAGASGIFVPGVVDRETIAALVAAIPVPLNVMVGPGAPSVAELGDLGVARASLGSGVAQAAYAVVARATRELCTAGTYAAGETHLTYGELNGLAAAAGRPVGATIES